MERFFRLKENGTTARTEIMAGVTTFITMAYILAVNPRILSAAGMDPTAVLIATSLAGAVGCLCMAVLANYPFALAPGLGLNAYFAYTICGQMGYPWQFALLAVFSEGIIFVVLSVTNVREAIFNAIPRQLKKGITAGIGLFVAFIGLQNAHLVVDSSTLVTLVSFHKNFRTEGIGALLALIGLAVIAVLAHRKAKSAVFMGILITWLLGIVCELAGIYTVDAGAGYPSLIPAPGFVDPRALLLGFGQCFNWEAIGHVRVLDFAVIICSFLCVDLFDTLAILIGVSEKAGMLDENGKLPRIRGALLADALATVFGAVFGTSTTTTYVESSAGTAEGGRTGLTALTTGALFLAAAAFAPFFVAIPGFATAPALIYVGFLMVSSIAEIDFSEIRDALPAYLAMLAMPLTYSISEGIGIGIISYTVVNLFTGRREKISALLYILSLIFILKYAFL